MADRVLVAELIYAGANPVRTAPGKQVYIYQRGLSELATLYAAESGETTVAQPLVTNNSGMPTKNGEDLWIGYGSYDLEVAGRKYTYEATIGRLPVSVVSDSQIALVSPLKFGAKFDGRRVEDLAVESGHKAATSAAFTAADAGKVIVISGAGSGGASLITTITAAGAGTVTLAANAGTTVTGGTAIYASDDSAAMAEMAESLTAGRGYRITCPEGRSFFNGVVFGSTVSRQGVTLEFVGAGRRATFIQPFSASGAGTMLTINGPSDSTSAGVEFHAMTVGMDFADPIVDLPYALPLVHLVKVTSYDIRVISRWYGTGTIWKLDGAYQGSFGAGRMQTGRYAIGIESNDEVEGSSPQEDTLHFGDTFAHEGNFGIVGRNIDHGVDSVVLPSFKSAVYSPTTEGSRTTNGHPDREAFGEGKLVSEAAAAATTIKLEPGQAAAMGYETANLPLPVMIDSGDHVEINKVLSAGGDTLTLAQPLQWAHAVGIAVVRGTVAINFATNVQSLTIGDGCHLEGHSCAAVQVSGGKLITLRGGTNGSRVALRLTGGTINAKVARMLMVGAPLLPEAVGARNIAIEVPAWNTSSSVARLSVEDLEKGSTAEEPTYLSDPGSHLAGIFYEVQKTVGTIKERTRNVPTAQAASTLEKETVNGVIASTRSPAGATYIANQGVAALQFISNSAGSEGSPGIIFTDAQEPSPKSLYLSKTANTQLSVKNGENTKHVTFDTSREAVIFGSGLDVGIARKAAGVAKITNGTTGMGTLAFLLPDVNTSGKTSAEITAAVETITGSTVVADLLISDKTNHLMLCYSGSKWFKTATLTEIT